MTLLTGSREADGWVRLFSPQDFNPVENSRGDLDVIKDDKVIARMPKGEYILIPYIPPICKCQKYGGYR